MPSAQEWRKSLTSCTSPIWYERQSGFTCSVGVSLLRSSEQVRALLPSSEVDYSKRFGEARRLSWLTGRVALHLAIDAVGGDSLAACLRAATGGPDVPAGVSASISHKRDVAVAIATRTPGSSVGIDVESIKSPCGARFARRVLTELEWCEVQNLRGSSLASEVLTRFSIKEALFKALHPSLLRPIGLDEVEVSLGQEGTAAIARLGALGTLRVSIDARYERSGSFVVSEVRVSNRATGTP